MKSRYDLNESASPRIPTVVLYFFISIGCFILNPLTHYAFATQVTTADNLLEENYNHFPVTAVDTSSNESGYSNEIIKTVPVIPDHVLTINKSGSGTGAVTGMEISCGTTCTGSFPQGTSVELVADPDSDSTFAGWSGGGCSGTAPCTVTMDTFTSVTAKFIKTYTITATADNNGTIIPVGPVPANQASDQTVTISMLSVKLGASQAFTIKPKSGYHVAGLQVDGRPVGIANTYTFAEVKSNHSITADFSPDSYTVTASAAGNSNISPSGKHGIYSE